MRTLRRDSRRVGLKIYYSTQKFVTGTHPKTRIFHPQYLVNENLRLTVEQRFFQNLSALKEPKVLDVGCGSKPYSYLLEQRNWFGIDVFEGPTVDLVIDGSKRWDLEDNRFDAVICTEVLEHAEDPNLVIGEIWRVLKPGGLALVTTPFVYGVHGSPYDYRRYTIFGLVQAVEQFECISQGMLGGIGSTLAINFNNWVTSSLAKNAWINLFLTPLSWIIFAIINLSAKCFDVVDKTNAFGTNSWVIIRKQQFSR